MGLQKSRCGIEESVVDELPDDAGGGFFHVYICTKPRPPGASLDMSPRMDVKIIPAGTCGSAQPRMSAPSLGNNLSTSGKSASASLPGDRRLSPPPMGALDSSPMGALAMASVDKSALGE